MSGHSKRHAPAYILLILVIFLLPILGPTGGEESLDSLPDLAITHFSISPTKDGYQGLLKIKNIGLSSSADVLVQVLDEEAGRDSNRTDVVTFPVTNPSPGSEIEKEFKWEPERAGTHILRAIVDINGEEKEGSKFNNVRSLMVTLPSLRAVTSKEDGSPDIMVLGDYISGIENMVDLELAYDDISDPSLMRVYITVPGHFLEYGTMDSGNSFRTSFDAGSLPPGEHSLIINSSYGGQHISSETYMVNVVEKPEWYDNLENGQSFYDKGRSAYVFKGRIDIPEYMFSPNVQGIGNIEQVSLFGIENEVFLTGYVLLDRTTTYLSECDMEMVVGDERVLVREKGKTFAPSPDEDVEIHMKGEDVYKMDLSRSAFGRKLTIEGPLGDTIRIPIPSLSLSGTVTGEAIVHLNGSAPIDDIEVSVDVDLQGNTTDIISMMLPGYDNPRITVCLEAFWNTSIAGGLGGPWTENGYFDLTSSSSIIDLGLEWGEVRNPWEIFHNGVGLDIAVDPEGDIGRLELSVKDGHLTHILFTDPNGESEVYVNNTYKSSPELEYLWDGSPLVVWTEAGYMEDRAERASSMRLRYLIGDPSGDFSGPPSDLFANNSMDQHPSLASDHSNERIALSWMRDMDGNISTHEDREIFVAFLDGSGWSLPQRITEDVLSDRAPDIWFDSDGRLYLLWQTGTFSVRYSVWSEGLGWSIPITLDLGGSYRIDHASLIKGDRSDPYSLLVTCTDGAPYKLEIGPIIDDGVELTTITASDHYISSPTVRGGSQDSWNAMWHVWDREGGDIEMSINTGILSAGKWSESLRLTSDEELELSPLFYWNDGGSFTLGMIPIHQTNGNDSAFSSPAFLEQNLSWGADTVSLDLDPGPGSSPGTMIRATALVEYRGMTPEGRVRVDIYRVLRDKVTGGQSQEFWDSEMVEFSMIGQTQQVEFNVPVKEFQLGFIAITGPALSGIPAHSTYEFSSLPAIPDIEILTMEIIEIYPEIALATLEMRIKNWGVVSSGPRNLVVQASRPTAPLLFDGGSLEPLFLREREAFTELNRSEIDVPAGGTLAVEMNVSLSPGLNNIWSSVKGPTWLPMPESHDQLVIPSFPQLDLIVEDPGRTSDKNGSIELNVTVENKGPWPLNVNYLTHDPLLGYGLRETPPNYSIKINATLFENSYRYVTLRSDHANIHQMNPGEIAEFNWTISPMGVTGQMELEIFLADGTNFISEGWKDEQRTLNVIITAEPDLVILSVTQMRVGTSFANSVRVQFINPTPDRIDVVHFILFNGFPQDRVIISEAIVVELGPGEIDEVILHLPLEEGQYILSATAEASIMNENGSEMQWLEMALYKKDIIIKKPGIPEFPQDDEVSMDDVTTAGIITISSTMFVLLVASFFYKREKEDEEEEKE